MSRALPSFVLRLTRRASGRRLGPLLLSGCAACLECARALFTDRLFTVRLFLLSTLSAGGAQALTTQFRLYTVQIIRTVQTVQTSQTIIAAGCSSSATVWSQAACTNHLSCVRLILQSLYTDPIHLSLYIARRLLVECNRLAVDIDNEIAAVHNFIRDHFRPQFPELESLVHHPLDYARVVQRIGTQVGILMFNSSNMYGGTTPSAATSTSHVGIFKPSIFFPLLTTQEDLTLVELDDLLPAATVMVVAVTATTTAGRPLPPEAAARVQAGCDAALSLDADKAQVSRVSLLP